MNSARSDRNRRNVLTHLPGNESRAPRTSTRQAQSDEMWADVTAEINVKAVRGGQILVIPGFIER